MVIQKYYNYPKKMSKAYSLYDPYHESVFVSIFTGASIIHLSKNVLVRYLSCKYNTLVDRMRCAYAHILISAWNTNITRNVRVGW